MQLEDEHLSRRLNLYTREKDMSIYKSNDKVTVALYHAWIIVSALTRNRKLFYFYIVNF